RVCVSVRRAVMPQTAEAIIIGAGVMGSSLAFHLTRAGMTNVLVADKRGFCGGMTAKSGARGRMHYTNGPEARLVLARLRYLQHWWDIVWGVEGVTAAGLFWSMMAVNAEL